MGPFGPIWGLFGASRRPKMGPKGRFWDPLFEALLALGDLDRASTQGSIKGPQKGLQKGPKTGGHGPLGERGPWEGPFGPPGTLKNHEKQAPNEAPNP